MSYRYEPRLAKLQAYLKEQRLDAFLVSTQDSIFYLCGASYKPIERPFFLVVRPTGKYDLIVPRLLAGVAVTAEDVAALGHGGFCSQCKECRYPICPFGK